MCVLLQKVSNQTQPNLSKPNPTLPHMTYNVAEHKLT